jgi:hypothetical protein
MTNRSRFEPAGVTIARGATDYWKNFAPGSHTTISDSARQRQHVQSLFPATDPDRAPKHSRARFHS